MCGKSICLLLRKTDTILVSTKSLGLAKWARVRVMVRVRGRVRVSVRVKVKVRARVRAHLSRVRVSG
jgi:hypothetical protein